jgi:hypothetical protein
MDENWSGPALCPVRLPNGCCAKQKQSLTGYVSLEQGCPYRASLFHPTGLFVAVFFLAPGLAAAELTTERLIYLHVGLNGVFPCIFVGRTLECEMLYGLDDLVAYPTFRGGKRSVWPVP